MDETDKFGSASSHEMEARMRDAGYEEWEIRDEMELKEWAEKSVRRNTEAMRSVGRLEIDPRRLGAGGRESLSRAAREMESAGRALDDARIAERHADERGR